MRLLVAAAIDPRPTTWFRQAEESFNQEIF